MPELPQGWSDPVAPLSRGALTRLPPISHQQARVALLFYGMGWAKLRISAELGVSFYRVRDILRAIDRACDRHGVPRPRRRDKEAVEIAA